MSKIYDDKSFIGNVIRQARIKAGLKQFQLAEKVDMSEKNLGNIENGKQFPQVNNLFRIIEELNLSLTDFGVDYNFSKVDNVKVDLIKRILASSDETAEIYRQFINTVDKTLLK